MSYENYTKWKTEEIKEEPKLSIVIPAYNERERIVATIGAIASHVSDLGFPWELLIADDGSKDDTVALCEDLHLVNMKVLKSSPKWRKRQCRSTRDVDGARKVHALRRCG